MATQYPVRAISLTRTTMISLAVLGFIPLPLAFSADAGPSVVVTQITHGPHHHYFGYIGNARTIPWSDDGRHLLALQVGFQDRMPGPDDAADVCLLDPRNNHAIRIVDRTRAWNPQQGTMFYWNPRHPETQFFFNDRDPKTGKVFTVLFDVGGDGGKGKRVREYRFDDTPVANSGVAQNGGYFTALNYGRQARLRPVTGYGGASDWTQGIAAPSDDGIFRVEVETGRRTLIVSFAQLRDALRGVDPGIEERELFINYTLHNRNNDLILFYCRADFDLPLAQHLNVLFTVRPDGRELTRHETLIGGHPEWELGARLIGARNDALVIYDAIQRKVIKIIGDQGLFPDPGNDIALSADGTWLVSSHRDGEYNHYMFLERATGRALKSPPVYMANWRSGPLRLDPAPCWNRTGDAVVVPGIARDGTRQMFLMELKGR